MSEFHLHSSVLNFHCAGSVCSLMLSIYYPCDCKMYHSKSWRLFMSGKGGKPRLAGHGADLWNDWKATSAFCCRSCIWPHDFFVPLFPLIFRLFLLCTPFTFSNSRLSPSLGFTSIAASFYASVLCSTPFSPWLSPLRILSPPHPGLALLPPTHLLSSVASLFCLCPCFPSFMLLIFNYVLERQNERVVLSL